MEVFLRYADNGLGRMFNHARSLGMTIGPIVALVLLWDPEAMPADWEAGRQRYFTINWIQFATTWAAFAVFLVALICL